MTPGELQSHSLKSYFDVITCMETFEHCLEKDCQDLLASFAQHLSSQGQLIVSVPIEIGPSLLLKQILRYLSGLRNIGDYKHMETYRFAELVRMLFPNADSQIERPRYELKLNERETIYYHGHKGFNYRHLTKLIEDRFSIQEQVYSPFPFLHSLLNSQVYFLASPKESVP